MKEKHVEVLTEETQEGADLRYNSSLLHLLTAGWQKMTQMQHGGVKGKLERINKLSTLTCY